MNNAIMIIDPTDAIRSAKLRKDIVITMRTDNILQSGVDYGVVPGSPKPTLLKPGAERLCSAFHFDPQFETLTAIEDWNADEPLFFYRVRCRLLHIETGLEVATGIGSCNSRESKYRWRWVNESDVPPTLDKSKLVSRSSALTEFQFAVEKAETTGKYGKPAAYWQQFKDAIANGTVREISKKDSKGVDRLGYEIGGVQYRIPNDDIFSLVNTVDKMACKRALIAAVLIGANASEFFTQDIEDMPGFGIDADGYDVTVIQPAEPALKALPPAKSNGNGHTDTTPTESPTVNPPSSFKDEEIIFANRVRIEARTINSKRTICAVFIATDTDKEYVWTDASALKAAFGDSKAWVTEAQAAWAKDLKAEAHVLNGYHARLVVNGETVISAGVEDIPF